MKSLAAAYKTISKDSLYRNSLFLMAGTLAASGLGFLFWILCAHYFTPTQIGLAGSLLSAASLLTNLSFLGLNNALIRHLAHAKNKSEQISTAVLVASAAAVIFAGLFLVFGHFLFANLLDGVSAADRILVVAYIVCAAASAMLDSLFVAERAAHALFFKNVGVGVIKLALPIVLIQLGFMGIFAATAIALFCGTLYSGVLAYRRGIRLQARVHPQVVRDVRRYAAGNYIAGIFGTLPVSAMPLLVTTTLGAKEAGYFYLPLMMATILNVIPSASAQSLFAESSHDMYKLHTHLIKTLRSTLMLLVPAVIVVVALSKPALLILGHQYSAQGTTTLQILAVASVFGALNYVGDTILNVRKQIRAYIVMNALNALLVLGAAFLGMRLWGLPGAGLGWLAGQAITMVVYVFLYGRQEMRAIRTRPAGS